MKPTDQKIRDAGNVLHSAYNLCPDSIKGQPARMRWMAEYFLTHYAASHDHMGETDGSTGSLAFDYAHAVIGKKLGTRTQEALEDNKDKAANGRECLMDVISHFDNLRAGLCAQRLAAFHANDADSAAYWEREISVLERMKAQAHAALTIPVRQDGDERARFEAYYFDISCNSEALEGPTGGIYKYADTEAHWETWQAALASNKAAAVAVDFPYQRTFDAIAAATKIEAGHIAISVRAFAEAYNAKSPAPIASADEAHVEVHVHLTKGGLEVSEPVVKFSKAFESRMDAEPGKVFKLYTHPAAAQPSREEVLEEAAQHIDHHVRDLGSEFAKAIRALKDK